MLSLNCCCTAEGAKRVKATLTFKRKELLYDAANYSYVEADLLGDDDEHRKHQLSDIVQDGNADRVTRVLNMAHAECVEMLYPYTKQEVPEEQEVLDDVLTEPEEYTITLSLPTGFSITTLQLLEHLIHEYLVCRVLADWMSITYSEKEVTWTSKFDSLRNKIQSSLISRVGKVRRKLKPF